MSRWPELGQQPGGRRLTSIERRDCVPLIPSTTSFQQDWTNTREPITLFTEAAEAGVPLLVLQQQVGHMSREMVEHYTHISQSAVHKATQQIEQQSRDLLRHLGLTLDQPPATSKSASSVESRSLAGQQEPHTVQ